MNLFVSLYVHIMVRLLYHHKLSLHEYANVARIVKTMNIFLHCSGIPITFRSRKKVKNYTLQEKKTQLLTNIGLDSIVPVENNDDGWDWARPKPAPSAVPEESKQKDYM